MSFGTSLPLARDVKFVNSSLLSWLLSIIVRHEGSRKKRTRCVSDKRRASTRELAGKMSRRFKLSRMIPRRDAEGNSVALEDRLGGGGRGWRHPSLTISCGGADVIARKGKTGERGWKTYRIKLLRRRVCKMDGHRRA